MNRVCLAFGLSLLASVVWASDALKFDGFWKSRGYGTIVAIRHGQVREWDINAIGCRVHFEAKAITDFLSDLHLTADSAVLTGHDVSTITVHTYDRLPSAPEPCQHPRGVSRDPVIVFDDFWQTFAEHYAFFYERAIDWDALRAEYRPRINANTSDSELFAILRDMISATGDLHVSIESGDRDFIPALTSFMYELWDEYAHQPNPRPSLEHFLKSRSRAYIQPALDHYLDARATRIIDDNVMVGSIGGTAIGYVQILGEDGFTDQPQGSYRLQRELEASMRVFDQAFGAIVQANALIIDLRINYGGQDAVSLQIAGRLTLEERPGFTKCARNGGGYTEAQTTVVPVVRPGFLGPVVVLVSEHTISAGDEILMIVKDFPNVVIVGATSAGDYSDPLHKLLSNGWSIGLSNERYVAPDGRVYEGRGIEPDVRVGFYPAMMHADGRDPGLEKAVHVLEVMQRKGRDTLPKAPPPPLPKISCAHPSGT